VSPRHKLLLAGCCLAALALGLGARGGWSAAGFARVTLGLAAAAGLALWYLRARGARDPAGSFVAAPRLAVIQRAGLSPRTGVALVEVDGRPYLVVHGEGFARVRQVPRRVALPPHHPCADDARAEAIS
jgi:hypothetical protein